jgi:hypothetical protein
MKDFKESIDGLTNQVKLFLATVSTEKDETLEKPGSIFNQLVQIFAILLESIEYKVIENVEQIKQILSQTEPLTEFLRKNKYISRADEYREKAIQLCDEFKFSEMKAHLHLAQSKIEDPIKKSIIEHEFKIDKNIENLFVKLHHACSSLSSFSSKSEKLPECKKTIDQLMIEFIYLSNLDLIDTYKSSEMKMVMKNPQQWQIQQAVIERIMQILSKAENKSLVWNFIYFLKNQTPFKARQNFEWYKKILCFLFFAIQVQHNFFNSLDEEKKDDGQSWLNHRLRLNESRKKLNEKLKEESFFKTDIEKRTRAIREYNDEVKKNLQDILNICTDLIIPPMDPPQFCLVAIGSASRKELLPYSDLECLLLVGDSKDKNWDETELPPKAKYLKLWYDFFQFYMLSFGESMNKTPGFQLDIGGHPTSLEHRQTPLNLIQTLKDLAVSEKSDFDSEEFKRAYSCLTMDYLIGNDQGKLLNDYQKGLQELNTTTIGDQKVTFIKKLLLSQLKSFHKKYEEDNEKNNSSLQLKKNYWQPMAYPVQILALYFDLVSFHNTENTIDVISLFPKKEIINSDQMKKLQTIVADIYQIRWKLHNHYGYQNDTVEIKSETTDLSILNKSELDRLREIESEFFKIFYQAISNFLRTFHWSLDPLPASTDEFARKMREILQSELQSRDEKMRIFESQLHESSQEIKKLKEQANEHKNITTVTPIYHIAQGDYIQWQVEKLKKTRDETAPCKLYIIIYREEDQIILRYVLFKSQDVRDEKILLPKEYIVEYSKKEIEQKESKDIREGINKYLEFELKTLDLANQSNVDNFEASIKGCRRVTFGQFYNFFKRECSRTSILAELINEIMIKFLDKIIREDNYQIRFSRDIHTDRQAHHDLGQTVEFKFSLDQKKEEFPRIIREAKTIQQAILLTIVFNYHDNQPALTGIVKGQPLITYKCQELIKNEEKFKDPDFAPYQKQVQKFWELIPIKRKWLKSSIELIKDNDWLTAVFNLNEKKQISPKDTEVRWNDILHTSVKTKKSFIEIFSSSAQEAKTQASIDYLNNMLLKISGYIIKFMIVVRLQQYVKYDYRDMPIVYQYNKIRKINAGLKRNFHFLMELYNNLASITEPANFDKFQKICDFSEFISLEKDNLKNKKKFEEFCTGSIIMHCILNKIVDKWNHHKNENPPSWAAWFACTSFGIIGKHIHGFNSFPRKRKDDIMVRLTIFRNELEKKYNLEKVRDGEYAQELYDRHSNFFVSKI